MSSTILESENILLSGSDFDRLEALVHSSRHRASQWGRVAVLRQEIGRGTVIAPADVPPDLVTMRSRVRVRDTRGGAAETWTLVYPDEADIEQRKVSILAPLGAALLGARAGQVVKVDAPAGVRGLRVDRILYQPEAAGDFHL